MKVLVKMMEEGKEREKRWKEWKKEGREEGREHGREGKRERGMEELIHVGKAPRVDIVGTFCKPCENITNH